MYTKPGSSLTRKIPSSAGSQTLPGFDLDSIFRLTKRLISGNFENYSAQETKQIRNMFNIIIIEQNKLHLNRPHYKVTVPWPLPSYYLPTGQ